VGDAFATTVNFTGIAPTAVITALPAPTDDQVTSALRVWHAAQRGNRTLLVIDVSGSMAVDKGAKIRFASEAAADAVGYLPDTAELGLWVFSTNLAGTTPWRELVPLGTIGSPYEPAARRQKLRSQAGTLPSYTKSLGDTGLYRTAIAAYDDVRKGYDSSKFNSVVLLTDGTNTDASGIDLKGLLSRLKADTNSSKPLPIFTVAVGPDADVKTLTQISAATGGTEYTANSASDIRSVFLDAVVKAGSK
jgi:hypothetical protein